MVRVSDDPEPVWDQPNAVPKKWIESVDEAVLTSKLSPNPKEVLRRSN
jgi:hypothetical protein